MDRPKAFILNMYCAGLGIARNLGVHGIKVIGISNHRNVPGNFSRYCKALIGPDVQKDPDNFLNFLLSLGKSEKKRGILFPTSDLDIHFVDRNRELLEKYFVIPQPEHEKLEIFLNKEHQAKAATSTGLSTPYTKKITSFRELEIARNDLPFPLVAKAVYTYQWRLKGPAKVVDTRKGYKFEKYQQLSDFYNRISKYQSDLLVQEWISGNDDQYFVMGAYFNRKSKCLGAFTAQKILQFPPELGLGCVYKTVKNEEVLTLGSDFLKTLKYQGLAELEFKYDKFKKNYKLIEVNPRHWDQHYLGTICGVNLSYIAYQDLCEGIDPLPCTQQSEGEYWIRFDGVIGSIKEDIKNYKIYCVSNSSKIIFDDVFVIQTGDIHFDTGL